MSSPKVTYKDESQKLLKAADKATYANLGHAGGSIRKTAIASIETSETPSPPGKPPTTRKGLLRRAILYLVNRKAQNVVIGPRFTIAGTVGMAHEFGGKYKTGRYPKRAFMGPALSANKSRLPDLWKDSIRK